jgi:hypothetical protein
MKGYLPTWMPNGFGLLGSYGAEQSADGFGGYGVWSDNACREVELTFNPNWVARDPSNVDPNASVGPWIVTADVPRGCSNEVLGKARCLDYETATPNGYLTLLMMGLDRSEGDRIALSIFGEEGTENSVSEEPSWRLFADDHLPWTVEAPEAWHMIFARSPSRPNLKTGVLQSWIGTAQYRPEWMNGPTLTAGASEKLGPDAVMVHIGLLWYPPDEPIAWSPDPSVPPTWTRDYGEHPDSQNPGWVIHERQLCQGKECVNVLIWHGPDASEADVSDAERVAQSVAFVPDWTDKG